MNIEIRKYNDNDYDATYKILDEAFGYKKVNMKDSRISEFVACIGDTVVGYFNLMEEIDIVRNIKIYHLGYVCVDIKERGKGIGKLMTEYAIKYAKEQGAFRIELTSKNERKAAHELYLSLGFIKRDSSIFRKEFL